MGPTKPDWLLAIEWYGRYWEVQTLAVHLLHKIGKIYNVKDRLPIFKLYVEVSNRCTGARLAQLQAVLSELVAMRRLGREPPHNNGKYV